jgi:hypothetical protein
MIYLNVYNCKINLNIQLFTYYTLIAIFFISESTANFIPEGNI